VAGGWWVPVLVAGVNGCSIICVRDDVGFIVMAGIGSDNRWMQHMWQDYGGIVAWNDVRAGLGCNSSRWQWIRVCRSIGHPQRCGDFGCWRAHGLHGG